MFDRPPFAFGLRGLTLVFIIAFASMHETRMNSRSLRMAAALALSIVSLSAAEKINEALLQKDFPFQGACISASFPAKNTAMKGLAIRIPGAADANMLFDTDLCRMAAGWTGGYINTRGVTFDGSHGGHPSIVGKQAFGTAVVPGVSLTGVFTDARKEPSDRPMPRLFAGMVCTWPVIACN